jgi:signal transduction histidine kinase
MTAANPPPSRPPASLSARLIAGAVVWLAFMLALGGWELSSAFRASLEQEFGHRIDALLQAMIADTEVSDDGSVSVVRPLGDVRFDRVFSGWYWQIAEPSGRLVRSRSLWDSTLPVHPQAKSIQEFHTTGPNGEPLLVVERDITFPNAPAPLHLQIAGDLREVRAGAREFDLLLGRALGLLGLGMAIAILIQVGFGLRPLRAMKADLDAVREGDRPRLTGRYPREVAPLADAVNNVLEHDDVLIERARTHVGNLAHSLKTPLSILQAEMRGEVDQHLALEQIKTMTRLIEYNLGRASAVAGAGRALGKRVSVAEVTQGVAKALSRILAEKQLAIDLDVPADTVFRGHREDLEEILGNLMENAGKWARARVLISARNAKRTVDITVNDDGPGMDAEHAKMASRRGIRLDEGTPGWGLGLSIASDLVAVNGGSIEFGGSELGGLQVRLHLPGGLP